MDNRKIILASYLTGSSIIWFLSRSSFSFFIQTFYQVRRLPGITVFHELIPFVLALGTFVFFIKNAKVNLVMDEVVVELRKVTWPSRKDVTVSTTVVIACIIIASFIIAIFDLAFGKLFGLLLG